jgi:hypothetical protein
MTEDGFTVVKSKKKNLKRKFEENVQVQKSGGSENESNPGPSEVNEIKAKKMKKVVIQVEAREERNVKNKKYVVAPCSGLSDFEIRIKIEFKLRRIFQFCHF